MTKNEKSVLHAGLIYHLQKAARVKEMLNQGKSVDNLTKESMEIYVLEKSEFARGYMQACSDVIGMSMGSGVKGDEIIHEWIEEAEKEEGIKLNL